MVESVKGFQTNEGTKQYDYNALANKPTLITQDQVDAALKAAKEYTDEKIKNIDVNAGEEYVTDQELQGAITSALTQAKENGDFKGEPGDDYVLTEADKNEIAAIAADLIDIPESDGGNAEDGFSPIATVTQTTSGAVVSITDKTGTTTATIANGKDGKDGADGQPGEKGEKGDKGDKGDSGDTGATGAQGEPGKDGADGKDGISATHSWNGTALTITSASGTSSADLKGAKGDKGDKGEQGIQGEPGQKGDKGDKPVKGTDYFTDADKNEIANVVKSLLPQYIPAILTSEFYGDDFPPAGTPGRIFFKRVVK